MRAAIAKRFSGDAAPELFRFFRISVGFGCEACACLGGASAPPTCIKDKHTPRSHRGNKGHISGQKGYWFFEAFMEQKQSDESPRETLAISQKNVHQIRCSMNIRQ